MQTIAGRAAIFDSDNDSKVTVGTETVTAWYFGILNTFFTNGFLKRKSVKNLNGTWQRN